MGRFWELRLNYLKLQLLWFHNYNPKQDGHLYFLSGVGRKKCSNHGSNLVLTKHYYRLK